MTRELPQPEKRKRATPKQIAEIFTRQDGKCAICTCKLFGSDTYQIDHIQPLSALGRNTSDNLQAICIDCHKDKTRKDNRDAKKGARIRGEKGQRARREKRGGSSIQSPGFPKPPAGHKHQWPKRKLKSADGFRSIGEVLKDMNLIEETSPPREGK